MCVSLRFSIVTLLCVTWFSATCQPDDFVLSSKHYFIKGKNTKADTIYFKGIGTWANPNETPSSLLYQDLKRMNMNTLRILFSYQSFYDSQKPRVYSATMWKWIEQHVQLAKQHGIYLILQLGTVEGTQFVPRVDVPYDYTIWNDPKKQDNFISLWKAIATQYKNETQIAGFSLFLEPVCEKSALEWERLANKTVSAIREVDKNHLILIERVYGENQVRRELSGIELNLEKAFPKINDTNFAYEFYNFETDEFTHQFAPWRPEQHIRVSRKYPDPDKIILYQEDTGETNAFVFNKRYLEFHLEKHFDFGKQKGVPIFLWGFGTAKSTFNNNRGGDVWLRDMVNILTKLNANWTYWGYEHPFVGIKDNEPARQILSEH